mgnify:CR=1 FL=1
MGSGPIKGFSVTLGVGILTTLFSVYYIARLLTSIYVKKNKDNVNLMPYIISVAEKGGTVGEIVDVMKSVYGEWQESFGF